MKGNQHDRAANPFHPLVDHLDKSTQRLVSQLSSLLDVVEEIKSTVFLLLQVNELMKRLRDDPEIHLREAKLIEEMLRNSCSSLLGKK